MAKDEKAVSWELSVRKNKTIKSGFLLVMKNLQIHGKLVCIFQTSKGIEKDLLALKVVVGIET